MPKSKKKGKGKKDGALSKKIDDAGAESPRKAKKEQLTDSQLLIQDLPGLILLVILYTFQGLPMGLFLTTVPMLFKKYLSYQEIGIVMLCTMPFSFKVFWSPIVELYNIPNCGKRKSWVVPMQIIGCGILFYLSRSINDLLVNKEVYWLTGFLIFNTFIITCQDIAVDSWAVDMLHPANSSYASSSQSVGHRIGNILSTTLFIALNSTEFCNSWIFGEPREEPLLSISQFIWWWSCIQLLITLYIAFFVPEKEGGGDDEEDELVIMPNQVGSIFKDILTKKSLLTYFVFIVLTYSANTINQNISQVYLTDELKFSKESLSSIRIISAPANILASIMSGYLSASKPFTFMYQMSLLCVVVSSYAVLVLIWNYPKDPVEQHTPFNLGHMTAVTLANEIAQNFWFTTSNAIIMVIADRRIAGIHITLLTSLTNFS